MGTVKPQREVALKPQVSGEIIKRHVYILEWSEGSIIDATTGEVKGVLR